MEELVKELRLACEDERYGGKYLYLSLINRSADAIEQLQALVPRWIPVKESLPEGEVIAVNALKGSYGYREYIIGYVDEDYESDSGYSCESEGEILVNVTHWMPLPEPPKEETE